MKTKWKEDSPLLKSGVSIIKTLSIIQEHKECVVKGKATMLPVVSPPSDVTDIVKVCLIHLKDEKRKKWQCQQKETLLFLEEK
jgi:hypothetical protein